MWVTEEYRVPGVEGLDEELSELDLEGRRQRGRGDNDDNDDDDEDNGAIRDVIFGEDD